jgi:protein-S-isoprenylcysteine O-methyltransferase Ste14
MTIYTKLIVLLWAIFLAYWGVSALSAKKTIERRGTGCRIFFALILVLLFQIKSFRISIVAFNLTSTSPIVNAIGVLLAAIGVGLAIWARAHLGRNWGMPMTLKKDAELVTTGPYAYVRNPIYSGVLLAMLGASLVVGSAWLLATLFGFIYFAYSAKAEEKIMLSAFPTEYPAYKKRTKMLIPYIF